MNMLASGVKMMPSFCYGNDAFILLFTTGKHQVSCKEELVYYTHTNIYTL